VTIDDIEWLQTRYGLITHATTMKLIAVARAAKASLINAALVCDEDIALQEALNELETE